MFVLWYVFRVASHMDISRDVAEGETLMVSAQTPLCLQRTLVALVSGPDVSQGAALPWCLSQACQVKFLHSLFFSKICGLLQVCGGGVSPPCQPAGLLLVIHLIGHQAKMSFGDAAG